MPSSAYFLVELLQVHAVGQLQDCIVDQGQAGLPSHHNHHHTTPTTSEFNFNRKLPTQLAFTVRICLISKEKEQILSPMQRLKQTVPRNLLTYPSPPPPHSFRGQTHLRPEMFKYRHNFALSTMPWSRVFTRKFAYNNFCEMLLCPIRKYLFASKKLFMTSNL